MQKSRIDIDLSCWQQTEQLGGRLWAWLPAKCLVFLHGALGSGKTTLTRGVLRQAGHSGTVKSPTYTIVEEYRLADGLLYHFDLYRLQDPEELELLGIRDYLAQDSRCLIEWAGNGDGVLPLPDLQVTLSVKGCGRLATIKDNSKILPADFAGNAI